MEVAVFHYGIHKVQRCQYRFHPKSCAMLNMALKKHVTYWVFLGISIGLEVRCPTARILEMSVKSLPLYHCMAMWLTFNTNLVLRKKGKGLPI